ncbi:hypothetical protein Tola_2681 [Tolumonas auensis DSM 9187]|uniref:Uncharacterized protein n=1 Tax=Tolumonas auensis (strain DSM 9187 / NBRC 110442 / TA 4) TaxID=595494 RepID=C4LB71_TOLAT|nr:hypothetical protein Tola_2681 [Tolumonas auensis DSM 9187]
MLCMDLKLIDDPRMIWSKSYLDFCFEQLEKIDADSLPISLEEKAKQKRIAQLLLILTIVRIKRYLESLFRLAVSLFILPAIWVCKPTKFARITPFIYFP